MDKKAQECHIERHRELHSWVDELVADYISHHPSRSLEDTSIMELIKWSHEQTIEPTVPEGYDG